MKFTERPRRPIARPRLGVTCPKCGERAVVSDTAFGRRDECERCGLWSWGGKALVDAETHTARKAAHEVFDALWRGRAAILDRGQAYARLRKKLGLTAKQCHMAVMDAATAKKVPEAVARIRVDIEMERDGSIYDDDDGLPYEMQFDPPF